ncbi:hypothetical protein COLO4_13168 [Corchorus olitorius]|uniref:Uncharacterized protein n=1 Tax=Corchorus olitorius TaxID=93759 RepID=A0A1R3JXX9_9ROSI|nr:hypothetical protein COLO4_13168 [Corchorus olitorius]
MDPESPLTVSSPTDVEPKQKENELGSRERTNYRWLLRN